VTARFEEDFATEIEELARQLRHVGTFKRLAAGDLHERAAKV
jgi:hypothetical protein